MKIRGNRQHDAELRYILAHVRKRLRVRISQGNVGAKRVLKLLSKTQFIFHEAYETWTRKYCPSSWKHASVFRRELAHAHYGANKICISRDRFWIDATPFKRYVVVAHELMHLIYDTTLAAKETRIHHPEEFWLQFISIFGRQVVKEDYCGHDKRIQALGL